MFRFGLVDNPYCVRCQDLDTMQHKLLDCEYSRVVAKELIRTTNKLRINQLDPNVTDIRNLLCVPEPNETSLTLHAEVICRILWLSDTQNFLLRPRNFIRTSIEHLIRCESRMDRKDMLKSLLERSENS